MALIRPIAGSLHDLTAVAIESEVHSNAAFTYTSDGTYEGLIVSASDNYGSTIQSINVSDGASVIIPIQGGGGSFEWALIKLVNGSSVTVNFRTDGAGVTRSIWGLT